MNMNRREHILASLVVILTLALLLDVGRPGVLFARDAEDSGNTELFEELKVFSDVLSIVKKDYVEQIDDKKVVEGAIRGMLSALDPHSGYLNPDFYNDLKIQTRGEFGGLGIEITARDGKLLVVTPMEGSPAYRAGVQSGDVIVKIDDRFTKDLALVEAVKQLRGKRGTTVKISVSREGSRELLDFTIRREIIQVESVRQRYLGEDLGYVRISQFVERTGSELKSAVEKLKKSSSRGKLKGLILDLRNNPGGLLTQAVRVSDMFLKGGVIVYTESRLESQRQRFFAHDQGTELDYPVVVLVNGGSASASEIVAGALQDNGRAVIVGNQTFGKGSVQTITPLENGGAITLTTALYYTKSGRLIHTKGIAPDVEVEAAPVRSVEQDDTEEGEPSAEQKEPLKLENIPLQEWFDLDPQVAKAYDIVKDFDVFRLASESRQTAPELQKAS